MRLKLSFFILLLVALLGCKEGDTFVTNVTSPEDWQPPLVSWITLPESELRGTVGIDVNVTDSSAIETVLLYVDGVETASLTVSPVRFELISDSLEDDLHLLEARAWDVHGNMGVSTILRVRVMNSFAQGPRVIWVPDSFATIQAAINAATDFDTIRVRDGEYHEALNTFGKGIWIESLEGGLATRIDGVNSNSAVTISASETMATLRGFTFTGAENIIRYENGAQCNVLNCLFRSDTASSMLFTTYSAGVVANNLFWGSESAVQIGYHWGEFYNNVIQFATNIGFFDRAVANNPLEYGYNLFWQNVSNYGYFDPGAGDVYGNPLLNLTDGILEAGSPAVDAGNPQIVDIDNSRSDIGPFGGPWAY